jgi:predicted dehydrogenase
MRQIRIGFIGAGHRSRNLMRQCLSFPELEVAAVCDRVEGRLAKVREAEGSSTLACYAEYTEMLRDASLDAVYVTVEPENAAQLSIQAMEAGKHVISEVPMTYSLEACWDLVLAVERTGMKYQLGEQIRHAPFARAWRKLVADGTLGKIVHGEGQYLHGMGDNVYWLDRRTGERLTPEQAAINPDAIKSRHWTQGHAILYLPHELSPMLSILDDRVVRVVAMGTRQQSYLYPWLPNPDYEVALMQTAKDTVLRLSAGFTILQPKRGKLGEHWYSLIGTQGSVETNRANCDKMKLWLPKERQPNEPQELMWTYDGQDLPPAAVKSGHGGTDYWPLRNFINSIRDDQPVEMDVYAAADATAPGILAAQSIDLGNQPLDVPDFRPGPHRRRGEAPRDRERATAGAAIHA